MSEKFNRTEHLRKTALISARARTARAAAARIEAAREALEGTGIDALHPQERAALSRSVHELYRLMPPGETA